MSALGKLFKKRQSKKDVTNDVTTDDVSAQTAKPDNEQKNDNPTDEKQDTLEYPPQPKPKGKPPKVLNILVFDGDITHNWPELFKHILSKEDDTKTGTKDTKDKKGEKDKKDKTDKEGNDAEAQTSNEIDKDEMIKLLPIVTGNCEVRVYQCSWNKCEVTSYDDSCNVMIQPMHATVMPRDNGLGSGKPTCEFKPHFVLVRNQVK